MLIISLIQWKTEDIA